MGTRPPEVITSASNPLVARLRRLARHNDEYRKLGQVLLEGEHLCLAWAERGRAPALQAVVAESAWQQGRHVGLAAKAAATAVLADSLMTAVCSLETAPAIAFVVPLPPEPGVDAAMPTVVLDRLQDAGNVGSILRSASAFGFAQVMAIKGTAALWSPKVLRAAMGAHLGLSLIEGAGVAHLDVLRMPLVGSSSHAPGAVGEAPLPWPHAWVFGNEGGGVAGGLLQRCRTTLRVPQPHGEESLNVAVAAGICLYQSARDRARP